MVDQSEHLKDLKKKKNLKKTKKIGKKANEISR